MVKDAINRAAVILKDRAKADWRGQTAPTGDHFARAIKEIEVQLLERFSHLRGMSVQINMNMILACVTGDGRAAIYVFDSRGLSTPVHDSPCFVCIGSGFVTGGNLLLRHLYTERLDVHQSASLAAYIIDQVSKVDTGVGSFEGESYYFRLEGKKPVLGGLKAEAFREYKTEAAVREKLIKRVWEASYIIEPATLLNMVEDSITKIQSHSDSKRIGLTQNIIDMKTIELLAILIRARIDKELEDPNKIQLERIGLGALREAFSSLWSPESTLGSLLEGRTLTQEDYDLVLRIVSKYLESLKKSRK
jgi:hypothetical protein